MYICYIKVDYFKRVATVVPPSMRSLILTPSVSVSHPLTTRPHVEPPSERDDLWINAFLHRPDNVLHHSQTAIFCSHQQC